MNDFGLDLAVIGNCHTAALLEPTARLVWWCYPRFDSDPIFSRLLAGDEEKGFCDVVLENMVGFSSNYERNTAIVSTILTDAQGAAVKITDFAPRFRQYGRIFRPAQLIRIIEPMAGLPRIAIRVRPTNEYGKPIDDRALRSNHITFQGKDVAIRLTTDDPLAYIEQESPFPLIKPIHMILGPDEPFAEDISSSCGADRGVIEMTRGQFVFTSRGRQTRIGSFPVGIDHAQFERLARRAVRSSFVRDVVESLSARALLIGVDRLDYSKGLVQRMEAIERFFDIYPAWRDKVTYLQIAPKSRSEIPTYAELEQAVGGAVGRINGKCGEIAWTPIRYLNRAFSRSTLAGLYRSACVAIVTPLRDGMNLVAKEYIAAQDAANPGVLILSRFTGAAVECEGAILVNPYDTESVARAIADALDMTLAERRRRHEANLEALEHNNGNEWSTRFLQSLQHGPEAVDCPVTSGLDSLLPIHSSR